jgi:GT2 family glycosyltransferase
MNDLSSHNTLRLHRLQSASWPRDAGVGTPEELCFRASPRMGWLFDPAGGIKALQRHSEEGQTLELSTFFGAFSLTTWCGNAGIDEVTVQLSFSGSCTLKIYQDNGHEGRSLLWNHRVSSAGEPFCVSLNGLKGQRGILYPLFEVYHGDTLELFGVDYLTGAEPRFEPRLAIVMPTFKREAYARRNIERIAADVLPQAAGACRLFVVDNGRSLELPPVDGVELIPNRNFGGSGGFARGVLEAAGHKGAFSHVLFCDDDVLVDAQSINRLLALLAYIPQDQVVSGGMLKMGNRKVLHEKSANVVGMIFSSNRGNDDLGRVESVARYDENSFATFAGWWFVCYPMNAAQSLLPFPFFVGWDDVEMGRRCNRLKLQTISLLGVTVWHEEFEKKDTNWRWFYHTRNGLVTNLLYGAGSGVLRQAVKEIMTALLTYRYERAEFMIDGLRAVCEGPAAISTQPADEMHAGLLARQQNRFADVRSLVIPERITRRPKRSALRKFAARVSMNGHLLPLWMFKSAREPADAGWVVEHLHSNRLVTIFRCPKVVYYEPTSGNGMLCTVDHGRYYRLLGRMLRQWIRLRLNWRGAGERWRTEHQRLVSPEFWKQYLGL